MFRCFTAKIVHDDIKADNEIFDQIATEFDSEIVKSKSLSPKLSAIIAGFLSNPLKLEKRKLIFDKFKRPENITLQDQPKVNVESGRKWTRIRDW